MEHKPLVSIVIACHNAQEYLDLCIGSLTEQTYKNIEILVCDDASTDRSVEILESWQKKDSRIVLLRNETNLKAAGTRNRCIKEAKGEYIAIQDADDYSMPDRIEKLLACFGENDVDFVSSAANLFSKDEHTFDSVFRCDKRFPKKKDFLWRLPFIHASTMFKTECIRAVDGYRVAKETTRGQDYDMFMRLYAAGFKGMNVPNPLYCIRADAGYIDRQIKRSARDECRVRIYGFKLLKLMPIGYLFALKPYAATFYHMIFRK